MTNKPEKRHERFHPVQFHRAFRVSSSSHRTHGATSSPPPFPSSTWYVLLPPSIQINANTTISLLLKAYKILDDFTDGEAKERRCSACNNSNQSVLYRSHAATNRYQDHLRCQIISSISTTVMPTSDMPNFNCYLLGSRSNPTNPNKCYNTCKWDIRFRLLAPQFETHKSQ